MFVSTFAEAGQLRVVQCAHLCDITLYCTGETQLRTGGMESGQAAQQVLQAHWAHTDPVTMSAGRVQRGVRQVRRHLQHGGGGGRGWA